MPTPVRNTRFAPILTNLSNLAAAGEDGFEGLLRDAVATVVGRRFSLAKAGGAQGGSDMATDPLDPGSAIAVEAKRYGQSTRLGLDQLKAKLAEAVERRPDLDLMVFAATRDISRDDHDSLVQYGDGRGVGVAVIDWPKSATTPPPLGVLCALVPEALLDRIDLAQRVTVRTALDQLRAHPGFEDAKEKLIDTLTRPDMGWSAARTAMAGWLRAVFASEDRAFAELRCLANLLDGDITLAPRPRLMEALDGWWAAPSTPIAFLGDEGVGKSWAPLAWWHERAGVDGTALPLTLVAPAQEVGGTDVVELVARLLARRSGLRDEAFWRRRVGLWLKAPATGLRFLLVFDGLNQAWSFRDWDTILAGLAAEPWRGRVAVILTCRPDHWTGKLDGLRRAEPKTQMVKPFDDDELDAFLHLHGRVRGDFAPDILPLLKVPRLSALAIRHRVALTESGDITRERLVYEDWKDRLSNHGARLVSHSAFHEFVALLGRRVIARLRQDGDLDLPMSHRAVTEDLQVDREHDPETLHATLSGIVDGRWMERIPGKAGRFRLNKDLTPYALGMALVDHLRDVREAGLSDELAKFLEPLREQDLAVDLLRAAVTIALMDADVPASHRRMLLDTWFRRQNFRGRDFDAFWRLLPQDPGIFFALAEETWLHRQVGHHPDEVLIKGFAKAANHWPTIQSQVLAWCSLWLGTHWDDSRKGLTIGYKPNAHGVAERCAQTHERRIIWNVVAGALAPPIPIRDGIDGDVSWLSCRALGILSYLPAASTVPALTSWAVSRAIMDGGAQADQVDWLLRLTQPDDERALREAVQTQVLRLLEFKNPVVDDAAHRMLAALATPKAARWAEALTPSIPWKWMWHSTVTVRSDGLLLWDMGAAWKSPHVEETPLSAARDLNPYATDPERRLSNEDAVTLGVLADITDAKCLWLMRGNTREDMAVEAAEAALARWAPGALGALYRRVFAGVGERSDEELSSVARQTPAHLFLLDADQCGQMSTIACQPVDNEEDDRFLELQLAALAGRTASEQIAVFTGEPQGLDFDRKHAEILAKPTLDDFVAIGEQLRIEAPVGWLRGWLWYLTRIVEQYPQDTLPAGYAPLLPLLRHENQSVRTLALEVACDSEQPELAAALADSGWCVSDDMEREEVIHGSLALINAVGHLPITEIRRRIAPEASGFLAVRDGATEEDLDVFAAFVEQRIEEDRTRKSSQGHRHYFIFKMPIDRLVERRGDRMAALVRPMIKGVHQPRIGMFSEEFPYIDLCRALLRHRPDDGAALWMSMREPYERGIFKTEAFSLLPFDAPDCDQVNGLRHLICDAAKTDEELGRIAAAVIRHGRQEWMIDRIRQDMAGETAGSLARGLSLGGLLDTSPEADALWRTSLAEPPGPGWLAGVHQRASRLYQRNRWAHHWFDTFLEERDRDRAFGQYALFLRCADRRALTWIGRRAGEVWKDLPDAWRLHWSFRRPDLVKAVETTDKEWKDTLFGAKIPSHIQWPWR